MITVLIADDQPLMRTAMRITLDAESDITVVGEAGDGAAAVRWYQRLEPDVVVMDIRMPIVDGIEATRRLVALGGEGRPGVLMMTTFDLDENIVDSLRAGARGFLLKDAAPEELVHAVRLIGRGEAFLTPSVTRRLLDLRASSMAPVLTEARTGALATLTARELAVLKLVARGMSNADVAVALKVAPSSVKTHVGHLLAKLRLIDRVQLVVFAYEHELIRPGWPGIETSAEDSGEPVPAARGGSRSPLQERSALGEQRGRFSYRDVIHPATTAHPGS
jgi:DNA-binding NarL/FixJ family response regulator